MRWPWSRPTLEPAPPSLPALDVADVLRARRRFYEQAAAAMSAPRAFAEDGRELKVWIRPEPPKGCLPDDPDTKRVKLAMDGAVDAAWSWAEANPAFKEGVQFMGYPYLSELSQRSEYRRPVEILAEDMTRKWIRLHSKTVKAAKAKGQSVKAAGQTADRIKKIEDALERHNVQALFRESAEHDGYFGRSHIYVDVKDAWKEPDELRTPLVVDPKKIAEGSLTRLQVVEPYWMYPGLYNASDPLDPTFFKPEWWYLNARTVHHSRFLNFVSRPMPDILKPAYAFGGVSLTQMMKPYVDNWLRTRQSVSDLVHSFSVMILATEMDKLFGAEGEQMFVKRLEMFVRGRDNRGVMAIDKATEELTNVSAPLGTLDALLAQSQEQMSAPAGIPIIKLFGITPKGLNATAEPEVRAYDTWVHARQEKTLRPNLQRLLNVLMLNEFGEIDRDIGFDFEPLLEESAKEAADRRKTEADTDGSDIDRGVLSPGERRARIAADEDSPYVDIDPDAVPEPPEPGSAEELDLGGHEEKETGEIDSGAGGAREAA